MNVKTLKIVFNELYLRLTEYSRLVYSKHQSAPIDDLKTAPQFSFSIKNLDISNNNIELILNFFACFENSPNSRYGVHYENTKDEYTINTKSHINAKVFETILWNCINNMSDDDLLKLYSIFNDKSKQQKIKDTFNNEVGVSFFLKEFKFQKIRTQIECFKKYYELYEVYRKEDLKEQRVKNEQKRIEQENQLKEKVRREIISNTQGKGGKNRNQKTNIVKLEVIKPLYFNKEKVKGITVNARANKISELLNNAYAKNDDKIRQFAIEYSLDGTILVSQEAKKYFSDDKTSQIYKWCLAIDKEAKK
ncbi:hypothetical protein Deia_00173 [Candidatus Deianiraea vastatrix]|uniref:Uncharacterized protein n=2 Tax=Candidatus Deianiraea vastatrix TaxID=2163644 RepID=A0A5B8XF54_9RICK|nr:hypothetical protein Deia_00173 [Candidatus Deianiraea vastatrix]